MSVQTSGGNNCSNNMNNNSKESKSGLSVERKVENCGQKSFSVRREPKNWDKIANDLLKEDEKDEDKSCEDVLRQMYGSADDETKRAMLKSFTESKGTTLSMDWKSVGKKYVKPYEEQNSDDSDPESDQNNN